LSKTGLPTLTAAQAAAEMARGAFSAEEYIAACLDRIDALEPKVQAFAHVDREYALKQARERDQWRQRGRPLGRLHGIPVGIKDIVDTADYPTECGTPYFAGRRPRSDATVISLLRAAGGIIIGKTVTTEFAYFHPGKTRNPHDAERTPGGSSSGSAAAVACGMIPLAIGSQTNGSIIRPGAFCGVFAMKATHGLVSRTGVLPLSRTLDHVGPFARSVEDLALVLDVIAGFDPADPDTRAVAARSFRHVASEDIGAAPRFAFVRTPVWDKAEAGTQAAFEEFVKELGKACFTYDLPEPFRNAWPAHRIVMATEMAHNLGKWVDEGGNTFSEQLRALIAEGRKNSATDYLAAAAGAAPLREALAKVFQDGCDAIITPAAPGPAPKGTATGNPVFCSLWTYLGFPAITLPLLKSEESLPVGVQLVGAPGDDARLLRTANALAKRFGR